MDVLQGIEQPRPSRAAIDKLAAFEGYGLAGWILRAFRELRSQRDTHSRQLRLLETLPLGGKKQLMLVTYGGEEFLVGGGTDSVQTILRLTRTSNSKEMTENLSEPCR